MEEITNALQVTRFEVLGRCYAASRTYRLRAEKAA
jgi:hypothetical protein